MDSIVKSLVDILDNTLGPNIIVFLISMLPILELRGGILAASLLGVNWQVALPICIAGTLVPIPFIFLFIRKLFELMKNTRFVKFIDKLEAKLEKKSKSITKYKRFGLFLFIAIPLPGTGAWTGAMIAALMNLPLKDSIISIILGTVTAGLIMSILSYGVLGLFM